MKRTAIGEFEEMVLLMVLILQDEAYMISLQNELLEKANRSITMGALHTTLSRLEKKGLLSSEMGEPTKERGGRRKRIYQVSAAGKSELNTIKEMRKSLWDQVPQFALKFG
ncbi:DNA-binding transcriptional regulator, PadR family [Reichenbachiella faecimaris]|uniref:DNA-binding transcriptional regulator, PadR family n=1 Tax=Reichenbachiella faecimaris TaxID=692418 RepID=A0A1W2GIZ1_REIFA|nr:helix-turn-helix transcriptional regulator [Reichenbachiella faecimaris]SMD36318.1 DNA-binding transcriptional regulator, PadR family [Reichenbachiella faecimaris]